LSHASGIRARNTAGAEDLDRLVRSAILVEEIAGELNATPAEAPLPAAVVERAREAIAILGMPTPAGGWETFEGFTVPYPPPPPPEPR
jgi:hypothetical protein